MDRSIVLATALTACSQKDTRIEHVSASNLKMKLQEGWDVNVDNELFTFIHIPNYYGFDDSGIALWHYERDDIEGITGTEKEHFEIQLWHLFNDDTPSYSSFLKGELFEKRKMSYNGFIYINSSLLDMTDTNDHVAILYSDDTLVTILSIASNISPDEFYDFVASIEILQ